MLDVEDKWVYASVTKNYDKKFNFILILLLFRVTESKAL